MDTAKLTEEGQTEESQPSQHNGTPEDRLGSGLDISSSNIDVTFTPSQDVAGSSDGPKIIACTCAAVFHIAVGSVISYSAILIPQLEAAGSDIKVTKEDISWIASIMALVVPLAALVSGYLVDRIGRINTIIVGAVPWVLGWCAIALAQDIPIVLLGRFLSGFASGFASAPAFVYITEIARPDLRGPLTCLAPLLTSIGMLGIYTKGAFLHWRTVAWFSLFYYLVPLPFLILWSPESPLWLVSKGRAQDALNSLNHLSRREKQKGIADQQLVDLIKTHDSKQSQQNQQGPFVVKLYHGLTKPTGYKPLLILTALFGFQQFSGLYITIFYAVTFFDSVRADINPYVSTIGIGIVRIVFGVITIFMMKSYGRRTLFLISSTGMAVSMFISGYITKEVLSGKRDSSVIPVICILVYMSLGVIGLLSIPWTITAELFPLEIRGMAQGILISLVNIMLFIALKIYPFLTDILGGEYAVQWLFAGVSAGATVFIFIFLPETHKKRLDEIQEYFNHHTIYILSNKKSREFEHVIGRRVGTATDEVLRLKDAV